MANWLDKALGRRSETVIKPVPFVRTCPCGTQVSGIRQQRARRMICAQCGEPHFILPANLYPESERLHFQTIELGEFEKREYEEVESPSASDAEIALDPIDDDASLLPERSALRKLAEDEDSVDDLSPPLSDEFEVPDDEPEQRIALPSPREERAGQRQKLLFVGVAFFVLVGLMVVWVVWDRGRESAEIRLQTARDAGLIALEAGDFGAARRQFAVALEALDTLGVTGERRDSIQDLWQECDCAVGLTTRSLLSLVEAANRTQRESGVDEWELEFRANFADQWVVIDQSPLQIVPGDGEEGRRIEMLWPVDDTPIQISGVDRLLSHVQSGGSTQRIILAGQLTGCRRDAGAWVVELNPENAFLWRRFESLEQLGLVFDDDQDARRLIRDQAAAAESGVADAPDDSQESSDAP